jgi:hypothetical protein
MNPLSGQLSSRLSIGAQREAYQLEGNSL